jgi:hypothetical protein
MGFIEETGAAQHYRDARITPIYEGTNGIQANDLVFRKLGRDRGAAARAFLAEVVATEVELEQARGDILPLLARQLRAGREALGTATEALVETAASDPRRAAAGAAPYLRLFGLVAGGHFLGRGALAASDALRSGNRDSGFHETKLAVARFYADHLLSQAPGLLHPISDGAAAVLGLSEDHF